ncbi:hypothetical protein Q7514_26915 [Rhodococcus artemisiae]|uniref:Uncharacterized protein n=1 Tax=Rhodococcus artemisiae TaxID=714159 RepID=A0ABU7LHZ4_9NOCA|nr:hypothetical protein [Rhodococcus artemisiae]MEE2061163.1 hypothetical protein [Rhodococcus artemisiae]
MSTALVEREPGTSGSRPGTRRVLVVALALIALQVTIRGVLAFRGEFYWDDLILIGRAGTYPLSSPELLNYDHDGHLMPGAFAVASVVTWLAPMQWWPAALTLVVAQLVASLAVLRLLWLILGPRRVLWAPLLFYLFSPLTLPAFAWWAAGLNSLPMQAALAWVAGDALQLARTGRRRHAVSGIVVTLCASAFFEKSVLVPFVAFVTVALLYRVDGVRRPLRVAWQRAHPLWLGSGVVLAVWAAWYTTVVASRFGVPPWSMVAGLTHHGLSYGLAPSLLGGPWQWDRWNPSPPWADPPLVLVVAAWVAVAGALVWSLRCRTRTGWVWIAATAYVCASLVAMISTRFGPETTYELAQTLRYFADSSVIVAVAAALVLRSAERRPSGVRSRAVALACVVAFVVSSVWSTVTFARSWTDNPTGEYLATAMDALTEHPQDPVLDHPVSVWVLLPVTYPHNLVGSVFSSLPGRSDISDHTTALSVLDDRGVLVPAELMPLRGVLPGPVPECGYAVTDDVVTPLLLNEPAGDWEWTVELHYMAADDGAIDLGFPGRPRVSVPVTEGLGSVYVRIPGGGAALQVESATPGLNVCIGGGSMGVVVPS